MSDAVDRLLAEWRGERPELDCEALAIVVRVQMLSKLLRRNAEKALKPLGLKLWEYDVLSVLRRQGKPYQMSASTLAREALLTTGAMTTRIDRLEERGWVRRKADPSDRRGVQISLSPLGLAIIDSAIGARLDAADDQLAALTARERPMIAQGLRKLLHEHEPAPVE
jgi:DNA-binding MarR family transcriptional regulator